MVGANLALQNVRRCICGEPGDVLILGFVGFARLIEVLLLEFRDFDLTLFVGSQPLVENSSSSLAESLLS